MPDCAVPPRPPETARLPNNRELRYADSGHARPFRVRFWREPGCVRLHHPHQGMNAEKAPNPGESTRVAKISIFEYSVRGAVLLCTRTLYFLVWLLI